MSGDLLDWVATFVSLLLMGASIKLMDDALDSEYDICRGERTMAVKLGRAILPYALVSAVLAAYFQISVAVTVFFASYALGMLTHWRERLPTRVPAYVEIVVSVFLMWLLVGWRLGLWGLAFMALIDWLDDVIDVRRDERTGQRNMALCIGVVETTLLILLAMCIAVLTDARLTALGFIAFAVLTALAELTTSHLWQGQRQGQEDSGGD